MEKVEKVLETVKNRIEEVIQQNPECKVEIVVRRQSRFFLTFVSLLLTVLAGTFLGMALALEVFRGIL